MTLAEYAQKHGLKRVGARSPFVEYIKDSWNRRVFAATLASYNNEAADARNRLGRWWVVLLPTIQAATYGLIFGVILGAHARPANFIAYLFSGVFLFNFMNGCFQGGSNSITGNAGLIKSLSFPRVLLPISAVIREVLNFWPPLVLMVLAMLFTKEWPKWSWLLVPVVLLLMAFFSMGLGMIAARLNSQFRDLGKIIPFMTRIIFYVSGVFFALDKVLGSQPVIFAIFKFNPFYDFIQLSRSLMMQEFAPTTELWLQCIGWAIVMPVIGFVYFWKAEEQYGRDD